MLGQRIETHNHLGETDLSELNFIDLEPRISEFHADVVKGLSTSPKKLPPKYLYDEIGSGLFDKICEVEEYYPTRTEISILESNVERIEEFLEYPSSIIEYGSGSSHKIRSLLNTSKKIVRYVPIDISMSHLRQAAELMHEHYPRLEIMAVCADYTDPDSLFKIKLKEENNKYIFFPGSTIGNLDRVEAQTLLKHSKDLIGDKGKMILGVDLLKDERTLLKAYNDQKGVTAAFNLNILERINRELNGSFEINKFAHEAIFNRKLSRIEMHLVSRQNQQVKVNGEVFDFKEGETIHTESSHKYSLDSFSTLLSPVEMKIDHAFLDEKSSFAVMFIS